MDDLLLSLAVVTAVVRDGVIIVGVLVVVIVQRGFDFVVSFCYGSVRFGSVSGASFFTAFDNDQINLHDNIQKSTKSPSHVGYANDGFDLPEVIVTWAA